ncbi:efflux RND transporter periplasmic adaptor subunit [Puniceicoccaceae bacterium K14]|nr:efflux RND transporter periplasmic adaptor subunit [Puniceicoccaceae bacterium K14]
MNPIFRRTFCRLTLISTALLFSGCGSEEADTQHESSVRPIKLLQLESASSDEKRRFPVVVEAATTRRLSFSVGGLIEKIPVKESSTVEVGQVIAKLVTDDYQNQLTSAQAQFENAEEEYQRAVRLVSEDAISRSVLEQRKSQRDVAKAQFDVAQKALNDATLKAPIAGIVTSVSASVLQNIGAGEAVATVVEIDGLQATVNLPASLMARIETRTNRKAFVTLDAAPTQPIEATFKEATLEADPVTQTFGLTFTFDSPSDLVVLPGMSATMELSSSGMDAGEAITKVSVPLGSILVSGDNKFVWVLDETSMTVSQRKVEVEDSIGEFVVVSSGLEAGETIAAAGASYLSEGQQVRSWSGE